MKINTSYKTRPVRFLEIHQQDNWKVKIYSISVKNKLVNVQFINSAKQQMGSWLSKATDYSLDTYNAATLILHEGKEGCFAIINWWTDENMLQHYVYLAGNETPAVFKPFANNSIITCVWEMAVLWFERNAWVEHVLQKAEKPQMAAYLSAHLNADV